MDLDVGRVHRRSSAIFGWPVSAVTIVGEKSVVGTAIDDQSLGPSRKIFPTPDGLEISISGLIDVDVNIEGNVRYRPFFFFVALKSG